MSTIRFIVSLDHPSRPGPMPCTHGCSLAVASHTICWRCTKSMVLWCGPRQTSSPSAAPPPGGTFTAPGPAIGHLSKAIFMTVSSSWTRYPASWPSKIPRGMSWSASIWPTPSRTEVWRQQNIWCKRWSIYSSTESGCMEPERVE